MLSGKKIILGVCGSIAAYKAAHLVRLLVREGAEVKVIMTEAATQFITPVTLSTLSKNPVLTEYTNDETGTWNNHVELGLWADLILIAPASANTLAKMAGGICDNLLLAVYLSARCPVYFAPAMDLDMWKHPATQANVERLQSFGNLLIEPGTGELASGLSGEGRLAEPEEIVRHIEKSGVKKALAGQHVLVSAGPTHEAIDPVRFIANHSSGKMGFAIAEAFRAQGAHVTLVAGPNHLAKVHPGIQVVNVISAQEMYDACFADFQNQDIVVMAAAVADYRPKNVAENKIKKNGSELQIELVKNPDILQAMGEQRSDKQILVGFALETEHEKEHAQEKLQRKRLDMIVLNSLRDEGAGFGTETNQVTIINRGGRETFINMKSKKDIAADLVQHILAFRQERFSVTSENQG
ncbi:MAG: bifunctional phosphopantothenoylcysteine decarboxylase/phosphopantothenate--cysteine ligase CoaBC [Mucilaginibacter polytrichastri]|nr:bifunctional phosphopantothenoylcysteine decarboxylase/phosphopantothenate--cysteine ligase CoaBC [Mucilaginibacter polytrichastri]